MPKEIAMQKMQPEFIKRTWGALTQPGVTCPAAVTDTLPARHPTPTILIHWGTVAAIIVGAAAVWLRNATEDDASRLLLLEIHRQSGMLVLLGAGIRIAIRRWLGLTNYAPGMPAPLRLAASLTHLVLYGLLIALPMLGWAATSAHHVTLSLFGLFPLPALVAPDADLADTLSDYHSWAAWALLGFVGLHALASLWHHFVFGDRVLSAMLPGRRRGLLPASLGRRADPQA
jgi:superoxide oxidase